MRNLKVLSRAVHKWEKGQNLPSPSGGPMKVSNNFAHLHILITKFYFGSKYSPLSACIFVGDMSKAAKDLFRGPAISVGRPGFEYN